MHEKPCLIPILTVKSTRLFYSIQPIQKGGGGGGGGRGGGDTRERLVYWVDVQADLRFCWLKRSYCRFCHALAHIYSFFCCCCCFRYSSNFLQLVTLRSLVNVLTQTKLEVSNDMNTSKAYPEFAKV